MMGMREYMQTATHRIKEIIRRKKNMSRIYNIKDTK